MTAQNQKTQQNQQPAQIDEGHPAVVSWNFIAQAMNDFANTLPPSAATAFRGAMTAHAQNVMPLVMAAATVKKPAG